MRGMILYFLFSMAETTLRFGGAIASSFIWQVATTTLLSFGIMGTPAQAEVRVLDFEQNAQGQSLSGGTQIDNEWADWGLRITGKNYKTKDYDNRAPLLLYDTRQAGADDDLLTGLPWGTPDQGNVLIIQEYQGVIDNSNPFNAAQYNLGTPDDEAKGGHVWFKFDQAVGFQKFSLLDIDDNFGDAPGTQVRVIGRDANNSKVLDINVDDLIRRFANTYTNPDHTTSQGESLTHAYTNALGKDINVTITQVGNQRDDNSMFEFELDETELKKIKFQYSGVSGAIAGLQWDDLTSEEPPQLPEPSVSVGLLMIGLVGSRKLLHMQND